MHRLAFSLCKPLQNMPQIIERFRFNLLPANGKRRKACQRPLARSMLAVPCQSSSRKGNLCPRLAPFRFAIALPTLVLGLMFVPQHASASPTGLTLTLDSNGPFFTVTGGKSLTLNFTLTNNSGEELEFSEVDISEDQIFFGDDDFIDITHVSSTFLNSLSTLPSGSSTNFSITFPTPTPTEPDFFEPGATEFLTVGFIYCPESDPQCTTADEFTSEVGFFATVVDASETPEPSSLILLGAGLLSFGPFIRRGFARS